MWQSRTPTLPRWRSGCPTFATWRNCSQLTGVTGSTCLRQRLRSPPTTIVDEDHSNNGNNYSNNNNKQFTIHNISQPQQNCAHCDFLDTYCSSWYLHYLLWFSFLSPRNFTLPPPEVLPFKTDTDTDQPKSIQVLPESQNLIDVFQCSF